MFFLYKGMLLLSSPRAPAPQAYVHSWIHELIFCSQCVVRCNNAVTTTYNDCEVFEDRNHTCVYCDAYEHAMCKLLKAEYVIHAAALWIVVITERT